MKWSATCMDFFLDDDLCTSVGSTLQMAAFGPWDFFSARESSQSLRCFGPLSRQSRTVGSSVDHVTSELDLVRPLKLKCVIVESSEDSRPT